MNKATRLALAAGLSLLACVGVLMMSAPSRAGVTATLSFTTDHWSLGGGLVERSSPTLADLDWPADGVPEVLIGTTAQNGTGGYNKSTVLVAMTWNGGDMETLWSVNVGGPINSTPAVGDIDGDGDPEVVVTVGGDVGDMHHDGGVKAYDHEGNGVAPGEPLWFFQSHDLLSPHPWADGVFSSPTLCDVDRDGDMEIAFGGWDQRIYLLDHDGNSLWNTPGWGAGYFAQDTVWSTAACADLNRDGYPEIIIGGDMTGNGTLLDGTPTQDGGLLFVFDKDGNVLARRYIPEAIYASPAVGDLDGDGDLEIVSGTSWAWYYYHGFTDKSYVYVFETDHVFDSSMHYSNPDKLPHAEGWPQETDYPGFSSPALADLDGNGDLEIVIGTSDPYHDSGDGVMGEGMVYAWHHDGQLVSGWPVSPTNASDLDIYISSSPTIADVDDDGGLEILFTAIWDVHVYNADGTPQELIQDGSDPRPEGWLQATLMDGTVWWDSPAVGDVDGDGKVEIWAGGSAGGSEFGNLWRFESNAGVGETPWPMFHRDARNSGYYPMGSILDAFPESLFVLHQYGSGSTETKKLEVGDRGDGSFQWAVSSKPANVAVNPQAGTASYTSTAEATVTVTTSTYVTGTYSLGNIVITGTVDGEPVLDSPAHVTVTMYVGDVHWVYLPLVVRSAP